MIPRSEIEKVEHIKETSRKKENKNFSLFAINTGSYIYMVKAVIINGYIHYQVEKLDTFGVYVASTEVIIKNHCFRYNNTNFTIPKSVLEKLNVYYHEICE